MATKEETNCILSKLLWPPGSIAVKCIALSSSGLFGLTSLKEVKDLEKRLEEAKLEGYA